MKKWKTHSIQKTQNAKLRTSNPIWFRNDEIGSLNLVRRFTHFLDIHACFNVVGKKTVKKIWTLLTAFQILSWFLNICWANGECRDKISRNWSGWVCALFSNEPRKALKSCFYYVSFFWFHYLSPTSWLQPKTGLEKQKKHP